MRVCDAKFGTLHRFDGKAFHKAAGVRTPPALVEFQSQRGSFLPEPRRRRLRSHVSYQEGVPRYRGRGGLKPDCGRGRAEG